MLQARALSSARPPRLLVVGCGDVGMRVLRLLGRRFRVLALTSSPARREALRDAGAEPIVGDLDDPSSLRRLAGLAEAVLYLAPPPAAGHVDPRMRALLQALSRRAPPRVIVYASTTGVYGDCAGALIDETRRLAPRTDRARRRVDAESQLRTWARTHGVRASLLRVPGIYAPDRVGGRPQDRVLRGTPALRPEEDGYTNHIHADDLARACLAALWRGKPQRVAHASDDTDLKTGDFYDLVADLCGLPRPHRIARSEAAQVFSAAQWSFLDESRRLSNARLKRELRLRLRYPTVREGLHSGNERPLRTGLAAAPPDGG